MTVDEKPQDVKLEEVGTEWKFVLKYGESFSCYLIVATTDPVIKFRFNRPSKITDLMELNLFFNAHPAKVIDIHHYKDDLVDVEAGNTKLARSPETSYNMFFNGDGKFGIEGGEETGTLSQTLETKDWNGKNTPATDKATTAIIGGVCGGIGIIVVGAIIIGVYCYCKKKAAKPKHENQDEMHTAIRMPDEKKAGEMVMESAKGE
uniref:Uncharacterized protein n=1 Tax=Panagrolaimus sp. JU765 TaxID=591449 RepID=A0AC34RG42_9BILA